MQCYRNGEDNENGKKLCTCSTLFCTFLCRCFARIQTSRNFLVTRFMKEMSYVFLLTFFTAVHFHLGGHLDFSFSHRRYKIA